MAKREFDEIEVDVEAPAPKSKKERRLEKKGKVVEEIVEKPKNPHKRSEFGVWIGNLPFSVDKPELEKFILDGTGLNADNLTRIHLDQRKGFAYVDTQTPEQAKSIMVLSEQNLGGRNVLIKGSKQFEGRPTKEQQEQKNPPTRVLFVGNLSFDTTDDQIEQHFQHCGEIQRIRTATFQDSGKCKGFTFIDFIAIESATKALSDKRCKKLNGRLLRMEYGEDRSQRKVAPRRAQHQDQQHDGEVVDTPHANFSEEGAARAPKERKEPRRRKPTPGQALANAQRGRSSAAAAPGGKKITFD